MKATIKPQAVLGHLLILLVAVFGLLGCKSSSHSPAVLETVEAETPPTAGLDIADTMFLISYANAKSLDLMGDTFIGRTQVIAFNARGVMVFSRALYDLSKQWYDNNAALLKTGQSVFDGRNVTVTFPDQSIMKFVVTGDYSEYGDGRGDFGENRQLAKIALPTDGWRLISYANEESLELMGDTFLGSQQVLAFNARGVMLFDRARYNLEGAWFENEAALLKTGQAIFEGNKIQVTFPDHSTLSITVLGDYADVGDGRMRYENNRSLLLRKELLGVQESDATFPAATASPRLRSRNITENSVTPMTTAKRTSLS